MSAESIDTTVHIQRIVPGLTKQFLFGKTIVAYSFSQITHYTIDQWFAVLFRDLDNWRADRPFLVVIDFKALHDLPLANYLMTRCSEVATRRPELTGRTALLLPSEGMTGEEVGKVLTGMPKNGRACRMFYHYADGLVWLTELLRVDSLED